MLMINECCQTNVSASILFSVLKKTNDRVYLSDRARGSCLRRSLGVWRFFADSVFGENLCGFPCAEIARIE